MAFYNAINYTNTINESPIEDDLSIIPFGKDTFAICELCGRIGRRGQFYSRNNKLCSLRCHVSASRKKKCNWRFKLMEGAEHMAGLIPLEPLPQLQQWSASYNDLQAGPIKQSAALIANSYEWKDELFGCEFLAAPVSLFKHTPLHEMWDNTFEGMKVEVRNTDGENFTDKLSDFFWVATVLKVKGYMGLLRYEGFGSDDSKDFWVNLCCSEVHPVGWCATRGKPLIPPRTIEDKYTDWKKFLVKQLTGARTLPANFYSKLHDSLKSRFSIGSIMEVVDKNRISQVKVASVCEIIGKRLHVKYYDSSPEDNGFWCHEDSPLIHPVGWAFQVGHPLDAPQSYCQRVATGRLMPSDTSLDMFYKYPSNEPPLFSEGMKLEAIDPLNLSAVCAATVMQILNEGYMMIRIDCYPPDESGSDWFCYHQRSPCIFPVGFALANNIPLVPPSGFSQEQFSWELLLNSSGARAADRSLFLGRGHVVSHGFVAGMRLECTDLMDPRLVCVATIARVVADMLKIHFDGWGSEYDQWLWAHSTDVYPVGWCRAVGHRLEGPLQQPRPQRRPSSRPPRQSAHRRRRKLPVNKCTPPLPNSTEESSHHSETCETKSVSPLTSVSELSREAFQESPQCILREESVDTEKMEVDDDKHNSLTGINRTSDNLTANITDMTQEDSHLLEQNSNLLSYQDSSQTSPDLSQMISRDSSHLSNFESQDSPTQPFRALSPETVIPVNEVNNKFIPRLINSSVPLDALNTVDPESWTASDVAKFLTVNDCQPYCDNFRLVDGRMMIQLTKEGIIELLEKKVGPSLKIYDLIQQLKCKIKQPSRLSGSFK